MMRKYGRLAAALCLCIVFLSGCGEAKVPDIVDTPSVAVSKVGEVPVWQVGLFDKAAYVLSVLQAWPPRKRPSSTAPAAGRPL